MRLVGPFDDRQAAGAALALKEAGLLLRLLTHHSGLLARRRWRGIERTLAAAGRQPKRGDERAYGRQTDECAGRTKAHKRLLKSAATISDWAKEAKVFAFEP